MMVAGICAVAMGPVTAVGAVLLAAGLALHLLRQPLVAGRLGCLGAALMLALPMAFVLSALAGVALAPALAENREIIAGIVAGAEAADPMALTNEEGWSDWIGSVSRDAARYRDLVAGIVGQTDEMIAAFLAIVGIYVVQLVILPALFLCVLIWLARKP